jgi:DNA-binding SARP family transcriptional activator
MFGSATPQPAHRVASRPANTSAADCDQAAADVRALPGASAAGAAGALPAPLAGPVIELALLGGFRLVVDGEMVQLGVTGQRLVALLACRGRQATRSQIATALWPDTTTERAHGNLRTALYRLQRACPPAVHATTRYLQLAVGIRVDLEHSTRLANRVLATAGGGAALPQPALPQPALPQPALPQPALPQPALPRPALPQPALPQPALPQPAPARPALPPSALPRPALAAEALQANLHEDLLPDWDEEWLADHRYRYRQLRIAALESLSAQLAGAGQHGAAVQAALSAVQADTLRDSAHEALIRACLAQGNRHQAYHHYTAYRRVLRDELGLEPPRSVSQLLYAS